MRFRRKRLFIGIFSLAALVVFALTLAEYNRKSVCPVILANRTGHILEEVTLTLEGHVFHYTSLAPGESVDVLVPPQALWTIRVEGCREGNQPIRADYGIIPDQRFPLAWVRLTVQGDPPVVALDDDVALTPEVVRIRATRWFKTGRW